ncbi:RNA polymerase sigma-70 factor (ECF subfamily) [Kribbella sp. VKM Ac-2571]|uniref:RNA polymerase sigma factor n=1 Tax=Kribbella sp. VKM Ac-2571 TaxID=2512222 RepID=UPI0010D89060|nr:sigma-70 family RNA polymerase sigma factor [Kribbella sp. VKM Ac-2571]TDO63957.1 RNA polymerase sigma-70 factor (ECF subfamily) [Kribbella sp. VKM Ac-2571]
MPDPVADAVAAAHSSEWAAVLAATARVAADLDLAEDCVQDAYAKALVHWREQGVPGRPGAWLTTVATRRALEHRRRADVVRRKLPLLIPVADAVDETFPDDRLRLVFTCCHPALSQEAQIALTLRMVCGLSSAEIAKVFLVKEATMQARITRAKQKISRTGIPYRIPRLTDLPERIDAVLDVIHLVYTAGYTANDTANNTASRRGLDLARMIRLLLPESSEAAGLLALLLLTEARQAAQVNGQLVLMEDQDRSLWDHALIAEALELVPGAVGPAGRFGLMAAIAAVHAEAARWEDTDWAEILGLYDVLLERWPSPVVALNRAVALSYVAGPEVALQEVPDDPALATYPYLASTRGELLWRCGRVDEARAAFEEALAFTTNAVEAEFLQQRITRGV